jgi:hypothetical protein
MIAKVISSNIEIISEEYEDPQPLGRIIMGAIIGVILFIL